MFWWILDQIAEARRRLGVALDLRDENRRLRAERDAAQRRASQLEVELDARGYVEEERRRRGMRE